MHYSGVSTYLRVRTDGVESGLRVPWRRRWRQRNAAQPEKRRAAAAGKNIDVYNYTVSVTMATPAVRTDGVRRGGGDGAVRG